MRYSGMHKKGWSIRVLLLVVLSYAPFAPASSATGQSETAPPSLTAAPAQKPLVVFYSRTGKTKIVANALAQHFSCDSEELQSTEDRTGILGAFTCVLDQLLDRDDILLPYNKDLSAYNPVIIATPIWLGNLSSPIRTFMKQAGLKDKEVYLVLTFNGRLTEEKEKLVKESLATQGITPREIYKIITKEKTEEDLIKELNRQLQEKPVRTAVSGSL
jgi:multimeric flavodoxin WrbA